MDDLDIQHTTSVEDHHWWYRERRSIIARELRKLGKPGRAIEIGAAGGGNSRQMMRMGWDVLATEYLKSGVEIARERGLNAIQADARDLPVPDASFDLLVAFDVLEHVEEDDRVAAEIHRVLRPGGTALIAVPCDMSLWSAFDVASGHHRRYTKESLRAVVENAGLTVDSLRSWMVLLRPVVAFRRRSGGPAEVDANGQGRGHDEVVRMNPLVNSVLHGIVALERYLPLGARRGVSLMMRAHRPRV
jgi:SAM-dependent methyltransferase